MENEQLKQLADELKTAGASGKEAAGLVLLAQKFSQKLQLERSFALKKKFLEAEKVAMPAPRGFSFKWLLAPALAVLILFIGSLALVYAQKSLPGETLYPMKIVSENAASIIKPEFKGEILRRRSEEIKRLIEENKDSYLFQSTIDEYKKGLTETKKINPKKIEESKRNLEEAKEKSSAEHKKEIERVIIQTEKKQESFDK